MCDGQALTPQADAVCALSAFGENNFGQQLLGDNRPARTYQLRSAVIASLMVV